MTHRERILAALHHRPPDRVPLDLGATGSSTITLRAHQRLRAYLNLPCAASPVIYSQRSGTVIPDDAILKRFGIDARPVKIAQPQIAPEQQVDADTFIDEWNVTWRRVPEGHFICVDGPFHRLTNPVPGDLEKLNWPDRVDLQDCHRVRNWARRLYENTGCALILNLPNGPVHQCQFMRGYGEWLEDLLLRPDFVGALAERITDVWVGIATSALEATHNYVDLVCYGDDLGTQQGPLMQPELYRKLIKPHHKRMAATVKKFGKPVLFHSCGSVSSLIPDLLDGGIDALNPIQVAAADMDTRRLKREFGRDLTFWGGIDTQHVLPLGTPDEVREEVRRRIEDLGDGGGYVLCPVHNVQPEVPPENLVAMFEAALDYGKV